MQLNTKMDTKTIIIASFINKLTLQRNLNYLLVNFNIRHEDVFVYEIIGDSDLEYMLTFKMKNDKNIDLKKHFENATIVNIKNGCIFSINGLNRLIEANLNVEPGNVSYKNHKINWLDYKDKLILSNRNNLTVKNIKKMCDDVKKL